MIPILGNLLGKNRKSANEAADLRWVADLPRDNPLAALDIVLQKLATIVTIDMPLESWRLKTLLLIDTRCRGHVAALEQQYISVQKLRPELDARMWDAVYAWYRYLSRGYQNFISDHVEHPDQSGFQHDYLPLIVARTLHNHANIARWRYMRYQSMPDGGWLALHRLYALAEREGFAGKPFKLYDDQPEVTICERYVETLMLDTLNHTNMSKMQIQMISGWLNRWLKATSVARDLDDRRFLFFTDLQEDRAARRIRNFKPTPSCRYWETDQMLPIIDRARKSLAQGKSLAETGLSGTGKPGDAINLLNQLFSEWSRTDYQRQRRGEDRRAVMTTAIVANGLADVWQQIKDVAQSATRRKSGYTPVEGKSLEERLASHSIAPDNNGPILAFAGAAGERWMITDESPSGIGARVGMEVAEWVKLGRLVALVMEDNRDQVVVGVIRSIKQQLNSQRHIGIEVMTRSGSNILLTDRQARATRPASGDIFTDAVLTDPGVVTLRALMVPSDKTRNIGRSMLLPNAEFNPARVYEVTRGMDPQIVKPGAVVEQKDDWIRVLMAENNSH